MEAYEFRAYEALGFWTLVVIRVHTDELGHVARSLIYKGDHHPIDEEEPMLRASLLLSQAANDLSWTLAQLAAVDAPQD